MAQIIKFPGGSHPAADARTKRQSPLDAALPVPARSGLRQRLFPRTNALRPVGWVVGALWGTAVLSWPVLRWVLSLDVVLQLLRMLWLWDAPGVHTGWSVLAHFALLTGLTCFVSLYRPVWAGGFSR